LQYLEAAMFAYAEGYVSKVRFAHALPSGQILLPFDLAEAFPPFL
jgi:hypothetical protein